MALLPPTWCWWQGSPDSRDCITGRFFPLQGAGTAFWASWTLCSPLLMCLVHEPAICLAVWNMHKSGYQTLVSVVLLQKGSFSPTLHPKWKQFWPVSAQGSVCQHWKGWLHSPSGHLRQISFWFFNNWENFWKPQESEFPFLDIFV